MSGCWAGIGEPAIGTRTAHDLTSCAAPRHSCESARVRNCRNSSGRKNWRPSKRTVHVGDLSLLHLWQMPKPASSHRVETFFARGHPKAAPPGKTYRRPAGAHPGAASRRCYATQAQVAEFDLHHASQDSNRIGRGRNRHRQLDGGRVGQALPWSGQAHHAAASSKCRVAAQKNGSQVARHRHTTRRDGPKLAQQFRLQVQQAIRLLAAASGISAPRNGASALDAAPTPSGIEKNAGIRRNG